MTFTFSPANSTFGGRQPSDISAQSAKMKIPRHPICDLQSRYETFFGNATMHSKLSRLSRDLSPYAVEPLPGSGGKHVEPTHFKLMLDCAQICITSADFMARQSAHHTHICAECAEICNACADSCEQVGDMDTCVQACRKCAQTCGAMGQRA